MMKNLEKYCLTIDTTIQDLVQELTITKNDTILEDFLQNYIDHLEENGRVETFVKGQIAFVKRSLLSIRFRCIWWCWI